MIDKLKFFRPEEIVAIETEIIEALLCELFAQSEVRQMGWKWRKGEERVFWDVLDVAEFFRKGGGNRSDFLVDLFVLEDEYSQIGGQKWWSEAWFKQRWCMQGGLVID